ncbi:MAG: hypothetical protein U0174_12720 [Polyangiaceae bacterium]
MKIVPYASPILPEFRSKAFRVETVRAKASFEREFFADPRFVKTLQSPWVYFVPKQTRTGSRKANAADRASWGPKLYVCVGAAHYWQTVRRLVDSFKGSVHWKFYMAPDGYDRPDKIVIYARSARHLREIVRKVRPLLPHTGFHELDHTGSTVQLGLERAGKKGLFVGADLPFRESWRFYRSFCIAWADWNAEYLAERPGGRARWLERMNLSDKHQGPLSLEPPAADLAHVRRYWKQIKP